MICDDGFLLPSYILVSGPNMDGHNSIARLWPRQPIPGGGDSRMIGWPGQVTCN